MDKIRSGKNEQAVFVYVFITLCTHERDLVFPPSLLPRYHSLSHSPLPVLSIFELYGPIRHNGAVQLDLRLKKTNSLLLRLSQFKMQFLVLKCNFWFENVFFGSKMQFSVISSKIKICNIGGLQYVQKISWTDIGQEDCLKTQKYQQAQELS